MSNSREYAELPTVWIFFDTHVSTIDHRWYFSSFRRGSKIKGASNAFNIYDFFFDVYRICSLCVGMQYRNTKVSAMLDRRFSIERSGVLSYDLSWSLLSLSFSFFFLLDLPLSLFSLFPLVQKRLLLRIFSNNISSCKRVNSYNYLRILRESNFYFFYIIFFLNQ